MVVVVVVVLLSLKVFFVPRKYMQHLIFRWYITFCFELNAMRRMYGMLSSSYIIFYAVASHLLWRCIEVIFIYMRWQRMNTPSVDVMLLLSLSLCKKGVYITMVCAKCSLLNVIFQFWCKIFTEYACLNWVSLGDQVISYLILRSFDVQVWMRYKNPY